MNTVEYECSSFTLSIGELIITLIFVFKELRSIRIPKDSISNISRLLRIFYPDSQKFTQKKKTIHKSIEIKNRVPIMVLCLNKVPGFVQMK